MRIFPGRVEYKFKLNDYLQFFLNIYFYIRSSYTILLSLASRNIDYIYRSFNMFCGMITQLIITRKMYDGYMYIDSCTK